MIENRFPLIRPSATFPRAGEGIDRGLLEKRQLLAATPLLERTRVERKPSPIGKGKVRGNPSNHVYFLVRSSEVRGKSDIF
jgi:hypothetical protein